MRRVSKISAKNDKPIEDLLGILDLAKIDEVKQSSGLFVSVEDVLRKYKGFVKVLWKDDVEKYIDFCCKNKVVSIDTETNNLLDPRTALLVGVCLYTPFHRPVYIPVNHIDKYTKQKIDNQISCDSLKKCLEKLKNCFCIYHNSKFDVNVIDTNVGVVLPISWDTMIAAKLLDENLLNAKLKDLYRLYIEPAQPSYKIDNLFSQNISADINKFALYSAMDPYETYKLYEMQNKVLEAPTLQKLRSLYLDIEIKVTNILRELEQEGAAFDKELASRYLKRFKQDAQNKLEEALKFFAPKKSEYSEWPINFDSSDQTVNALRIMGIDCEDSREPTLKALSIIYPVCQTILDYRRNNHMVTAFFAPYLESINSKTGKIHASFNQLGKEEKTVVTGRMSCDSPNLQQLPAFDDSVRLCFKGSDIVKNIDFEDKLTLDIDDEVETADGFKFADEVKISDCLVNFDTGEIYKIEKIDKISDRSLSFTLKEGF